MSSRVSFRLVVLLSSALLLAGITLAFQPAGDSRENGLQRPGTASAALRVAATWSRGLLAPQRVHAAASSAAGAALFHEKGCIACHGDDLQGTDKGPRLTGVGRTLKREQIEHQIRNGGDNMPAFGEDAVSPDELTALGDFLAHQKKRK